MKMRRFKDSDAKEVSSLIQRTFKKDIAVTFTKRGAKHFLKYETPEHVLMRGRTREVLVAVSGGKIVGVVEIAKDGSRIRRLFVDSNHQRKGIGSELFRRMEKLCLMRKPRSIKIYSSINATGFYENMGYRKFGNIRKNKEGIVYQLMVKKFR